MVALAVPTEAVRRIIVVLLSATAIEIRIESLTIETIVVVMALAIVVVIVGNLRNSSLMIVDSKGASCAVVRSVRKRVGDRRLAFRSDEVFETDRFSSLS